MSLDTIFGNRRRLEPGLQAADVVCPGCRRTRMPYDPPACPRCGAQPAVLSKRPANRKRR